MGAIELILVRHGESLGNAAATRAERAGAESIDVPMRDADVPLTELGLRQADALGAWLAEFRVDDRPQSLWASPYERARATAATALERSGLGIGMRLDERLRDRELGITDLLTTRGVELRLPAEAARRRWLGKFYYRPPGGESWADLVLRVRSVLSDIDLVDDGSRVMLVCHDAMVLMVRYVCEGLSERELLEIGSTTAVANASITRLVRPSGAGRWSLESFNQTAHLPEAGVPITTHGGDSDVVPR